jgi:acyl-CoA synthetase (AMP-forming)/AMP-acid ligase II
MSVRQAAVVAESSSEGVLVRAFIATNDGTRLSTIAIKSFCSKHLPVYMIPDSFSFHSSLPATSTGKIDYQGLKAL